MYLYTEIHTQTHTRVVDLLTAIIVALYAIKKRNEFVNKKNNNINNKHIELSWDLVTFN